MWYSRMITKVYFRNDYCHILVYTHTFPSINVYLENL